MILVVGEKTMLLIIIGLLALTVIFKLLGKEKEYGCLMNIIIFVILWKTGLLMVLIRGFVAILRWVSSKLLYYGFKLTDYLDEHVLNFIFFN